MIGDWGEVVTRYPYRKVGMDHLLSRSSLELRARVLQVEPAGKCLRLTVEWRCEYDSWSPTPQFSGAIAFGALPDNRIDEQDHRKVINARANA